MSPTGIVATAGGITFIGSWAQGKGWPSNAAAVIVSYLGLIVVVSLLAETRVRPLVSAFAWLLLLGAAFGGIPALANNFKPSTTKTPSKKEDSK